MLLSKTDTGILVRHIDNREEGDNRNNKQRSSVRASFVSRAYRSVRNTWWIDGWAAGGRYDTLWISSMYPSVVSHILAILVGKGYLLLWISRPNYLQVWGRAPKAPKLWTADCSAEEPTRAEGTRNQPKHRDTETRPTAAALRPICDLQPATFEVNNFGSSYIKKKALYARSTLLRPKNESVPAYDTRRIPYDPPPQQLQ